MTRTQLIAGLDRLAESKDTKASHEQADEMILAWLRQLGMTEIADAWEAVPKVYS